MQIELRKQAQKYLDHVDMITRRKLYRAIEKLSQWEGDIRPLKGLPNHYRCKIYHYRILFKLEMDRCVIVVIEINTRTNIKY
ncbi:MAG: addiction module toxin RelE [Clostridiales bacterium]|nr:addiction module toxin RelE [Clostridiales bacterium]